MLSALFRSALLDSRIVAAASHAKFRVFFPSALPRARSYMGLLLPTVCNHSLSGDGILGLAVCAASVSCDEKPMHTHYPNENLAFVCVCVCALVC